MNRINISDEDENLHINSFQNQITVPEKHLRSIIILKISSWTCKGFLKKPNIPWLCVVNKLISHHHLITSKRGAAK